MNYRVYCAATKRYGGQADYRFTTKWVSTQHGPD